MTTGDTSEMSSDVIASSAVVQFTAGTASASESGTSITLTVTRTGGAGSTTSVEYTSANGTATAGSDYTAVSGTLTFGPGDTSHSIVVPIASDTLDESDETFTVTLANVAGGNLGSPATETITITDDDGAPALILSDGSAIETNAGTNTMTFDVTLSSASGNTVTVDYTTTDGTATSGSDYGARFGTLTFAPGETARTVTVTVNGDTAAEADETVVLQLSSSVNASIADGTGTGTILNDDGDPSIAIGDATIIEGSSGSSNAALEVVLSNPSSSTIAVDYTTTGNTATSGSDFTASSGTLTFPPGVTTRTILVAVSGDTTVEGNEALAVDLSNPSNASIADAQATVTIVDDDGSPALTISDLAVNEAAGTAGVTVLLAPASAQTVSVSWTTVDGTATAGSDFTAAGGTLTFTPGQTAQTIDVTIAADNVRETAEEFAIALSGAVNATVAGGDATVTIVDDDPTPRISVGDLSVAESGTASFDVTFSNASASAVMVNYLTIAGSAGAADYAPSSGTLTFAPGEVTKTVNVLTTADALQEPDEAFFFDLSGASNAVVVRPRATATITDDDGTPALLIGDASVLEGDSGTVTASFTVTLAGNATQTVTVDYATANGTATSGSDHAAASGTLVFTPGTTTRTISVALAGDTLVEADETFFVNLSNATAATISDNQALGTILNDDVAPVVPDLTIDDANVTEGNGGTAMLTFAVTLSSATTSTVTVDYASVGNTALSGSDFGAVSGTLVFTPGSTTRTVSVAVVGDLAVEGDETLTLNLSNAAGGTLLDAQATGTILDDDVAAVVPAISIGDANVTEGDGGTANLTFAVTLSAATTNSVTVDYATANGTAVAGTDYASDGGTLVFAPGVLSQQIVVAVAGDSDIEGDETVVVNLSGAANATLFDAQATGTILDDDVAAVVPAISIGDANVTEGNSGTTLMSFNVTLSAATTSTVTVDYATASGSANAGTDYASNSGTLVFAPGVTSQAIFIAVAGDTVVEGSETFAVNLSAPSNATLFDAQATGTILDDDTAAVVPSISIGDANATEGNSGTTLMSFNVTLSAATTNTVTVDYATAGGSANAGTDYASNSGTLVFAPGVTSQAIVIAVAGDIVAEGIETFAVNLSAPSNATLFDAQATGTILDDDTAAALPALSIGNVSLMEGDTGSRAAIFTITLDGPATTTVRVSYATEGGSATAGEDFTSSSGRLTFSPGVMSQTICVGIAGDTLVEENETFTVILDKASNADIADAAGRGTILNDDDGSAPSVSVDDVEVNESERSAIFTLRLSAPAVRETIVTYATAGESATPGSDYHGANGTVVFAAGELTRTIEVPLVDDVLVEGDETFAVELSTGARAMAVIHDDDGGVVAAILAVGGSGAGNSGSFFRTVIQMHNPSDVPSSGTLIVRPMGGGEPRTFGYALAARETRDLTALIDISGFITADLVSTTGALPHTAVRVFNDAGPLGRLGTTATFVPVSRAIGAGKRGILIAPDDAAATRFNVGVRSLANGAVVTFTLRRAGGGIAAGTARSLGPTVLLQIAAAALFDAPLENNDAIDIAVSAGSAVVYGSSVDNVSQDPSFIVAEPLP